MTVLPTPSPGARRLLKATIRSARADDTRWDQQRALLRSVASYDSGTQAWNTWIGALGLATVETLQTLFDAARIFGTEIHVGPVPVPDWWTGPAFTGDAEVAALLAAKSGELRDGLLRCTGWVGTCWGGRERRQLADLLHAAAWLTSQPDGRCAPHHHFTPLPRRGVRCSSAAAAATLHAATVQVAMTPRPGSSPLTNTPPLTGPG